MTFFASDVVRSFLAGFGLTALVLAVDIVPKLV